MVKRTEQIGINESLKKMEIRRINQPGNVSIFMDGMDNMHSKTTLGFHSEYPVQKIAIDSIEERKKGNQFNVSETGIDSLAESIKNVGLIDPIQVVSEYDSELKREQYYVIAGHRRLKAFKLLHSNDPDNEAYCKIPAVVYIITDDKEQQGQIIEDYIYISSETEERIYLDSNLESRQLSYNEVALQIEYIIDKIESEVDFRKKLNETRRANVKDGTTYEVKQFDLTNEIIRILSSYNYTGWSKNVIRNYLWVRTLSKYDADARAYLKRIQGKECLAVKTAYKACKEKVSFLQILNSPVKTKRKLTEDEEEKRSYWKEMSEEQQVAQFDELFLDYLSKKNTQDPTMESIADDRINKQILILSKEVRKISKIEKEKLSDKDLEEIKKIITKLEDVVA